ncbi:tRNA (adenosine(37)-N6)-threonylcarbamoyltransferase complex dimerization subunit type 1 TsaB [bacterium]|nr:tRNA (adenosine(37)-N6)-threonylcarbamoyltransferase complex dimerization subunit type 1 TsaB [bacterium]
MIVLSMDTSTRTGSVAVVEKSGLIAEYNLNIAETHTSRLMPMIDQVLRDARFTIKEMDAIAVGLGPGSFTGLRIGIATAKGLAMALNKPIVGIPTLDALAHNLSSAPGLICPILDAKRGEIYTALYRYRGYILKKLTENLVLPMRDLLPKINEPVTFLGDAIDIYQDLIEEELGKKASFAPISLRLPRAANVAVLAFKKLKAGKEGPLHRIKPLYIRRAEAEVRWQERKRQKKSPLKG